VPSKSVRQLIEALQTRYVRALDSKDMDGWLACFGDHGEYVCTTHENESQGLPVAIMMDDSPERMQDRVRFIEKVWVGTYEDYLTRHIVQLVGYEEGDRFVKAETSFMITYCDEGGASQMLATGLYHDEVELLDDRALFRSKKAVIDSSVTPRYLVYPI